MSPEYGTRGRITRGTATLVSSCLFRLLAFGPIMLWMHSGPRGSGSRPGQPAGVQLILARR